jgi:DNA-binding NtrC family response regulator
MNPNESRLRILVAHPNGARLELVSEHLSNGGFDCVEVRDGLSAWSQFRRNNLDIIVSSSSLPGLSGVDLLSRIRAVSTIPILMEVGPNDVSAAVAAVRLGADDVIQHSEPMAVLSERLSGIIRRRPSISTDAVVETRLPGKSPSIVRLRDKLHALAGLRVPVLFRGESGSGRTYAAITLCASTGIDPSSVELVAARAPAPGRPGQTDRRVHLLRNVSDLPRADQARWTETLQVAPHDSHRRVQRLMATTDTDLERLAESGGFDVELAGLLSKFVVDIPPLRSYRKDMRPLVERMAREAAHRIGRERAVFTPRAIGVLQQQSWPGNVLQLQETVEQLVAFSRDGTVTKNRVEQLLSEATATVASLRRVTDKKQRAELIGALESADGNLAEVARRLGMSRGAIIYRAQKFGLLPTRNPRRPNTRTAHVVE